MVTQKGFRLRPAGRSGDQLHLRRRRSTSSVLAVSGTLRGPWPPIPVCSSGEGKSPPSPAPPGVEFHDRAGFALALVVGGGRFLEGVGNQREDEAIDARGGFDHMGYVLTLAETLGVFLGIQFGFS